MAQIHANTPCAIRIEVARSALRRVVAVLLAEVDGEEFTMIRCRAYGLIDFYYLWPISIPLFAVLAYTVKSAVRDAMGSGGPYTVCSRPWRKNRILVLWIVGRVVIHSLTGTYLTRAVVASGSLSTSVVPSRREKFVAGLVGVEVAIELTTISYRRATIDRPESEPESVCKVVVIDFGQVVDDRFSRRNVITLDQG